MDVTTDLYMEYAPSKHVRKGIMVPTSRQKQGFRSVYMFDRAAATEIKATKNSRNFRNYTLHSDRLFIDLDDANAASHAQQIAARLRKANITFYVWFSGKKGYHFEIPHELKKGSWDLCYTQRKVADRICRGICLPDPSIYQPHSIIRLPGTVHEDTGKAKVLVDHYAGRAIQYQVEPVPQQEEERKMTAKVFSIRANEEPSTAVLQGFWVRYGMHIGRGQAPADGTRYQTLWSLGKNMYDLGMEKDLALDLLLRLNLSWGGKAKPDQEVIRACDDAYRDTTPNDSSRSRFG